MYTGQIERLELPESHFDFVAKQVRTMDTDDKRQAWRAFLVQRQSSKLNKKNLVLACSMHVEKLMKQGVFDYDN